MNAKASEMESKVQQLLRMGFNDEYKVNAALDSSNNDIDSAINILVNWTQKTLPKQSSISIEDETSVSIFPRAEFPVDQLSELETSLYIEKWNIPCLRCQSFGICLQSAVRIIRDQGVDVLESIEALNRFVNQCLGECLNKLLTSSAVLAWDPETLEGVHNMLELVIQLCVECLSAINAEYLASGWSKSSPEDLSSVLPSSNEKLSVEAISEKHSCPFGKSNSAMVLSSNIFRYLERIFDPECHYHQRCRDRMTNTGTYVDEFNHWSKAKPPSILNEANASLNKMNDEGKDVFAEMLPAPKNFYLVNLLNCFGVHGGFRLFRWYATRHLLALTKLNLIMAPLANIVEFLTPSTLLRYVSWIGLRALWQVNNLSPEDFNLQDSQVFELVTNLRILGYRLSSLKSSTISLNATSSFSPSMLKLLRQPDWDNLISESELPMDVDSVITVAHIDAVHLSILFTSLCPPIGVAPVSGGFKDRLYSFRHLIEQIEEVRAARLTAQAEAGLAGGSASGRSSSLLASENQAFLKRRRFYRLIRFDTLMTWIREKRVVQALMKNLDNVTIAAKLCELIRCLGDQITLEDITVLWKRQETQNNSAVTNILKLFSEVAANSFNQSQLKHLFNLIRESWIALDIQTNLQFTRSIQNVTNRRRRRSSGTNSRPALSNPSLTPPRIPAKEPTTVRNARTCLLNLVATVGVNSREAVVSDLCLKLLWQLAHGFARKGDDNSPTQVPTSQPDGSVIHHHHPHHQYTSIGKTKIGKFLSSFATAGGGGITTLSILPLDTSGGGSHTHVSHPEPIEAALGQHITVLRDCHLPAHEARLQLSAWLTIAVEELKRGKLAYFVLGFIQTILELILKPLPGKSKKEHLRELNKSHCLIEMVCNSLHRFQKQAISIYGLNLTADSPNELNIRHGDLINRHLTILHYILITSDVKLSLDRSQSIWESLVNDLKVPLYGLEECLSWFAKSLELLETEAQTAIFTKNFLNLNPSSIRSLKGFESFELFFVKVNLNEGKFKMHQDAWQVERTDLIGIDFLWDIYTSLPPAVTSSQASLSSTYHPPATLALATPTHHHVFEETPERLRQAVHKARKLLLLVCWSRLVNKLKREPDACHRRFFDACRKRISLNLNIERPNVSASPGALLGNGSSVRTLLADTGQFLAALLVGPKTTASARRRYHKSSHLAIHRFLYIIFSYIENVEDELIGGRKPPPCWKPHYITFRGWEMRIPIRIFSPTGQIIVSSRLPLSSRETFPLLAGLCLSDRTQDIFYNPILMVHSNDTLAALRRQASMIVSTCLYSRGKGNLLALDEQLSLEPVKKVAQSNNLREMSNRHRRPPLSDPKSETPLEHTFDREAIGEMGLQTGRRLVIRLQSATGGNQTKESSPARSGKSSSSFITNGDSGLNSSRNSVASTSSLLHPSAAHKTTSHLSTSLFPTVASFLTGGSGTSTSMSVSSNGLDGAKQLTASALPSLVLASGPSVYELLFELAENDLEDISSHPTFDPSQEAARPNLLHLIRLLLYCLPTYRPPPLTSPLPSHSQHCKQTGGGGKGVSTSFANSMRCSPENLVNASQFRLLYLLQVLSGSLVARDSSAWWERFQCSGGYGPLTAPSSSSSTTIDTQTGFEIPFLKRPKGKKSMTEKPCSTTLIKQTSDCILRDVEQQQQQCSLISSESCLAMTERRQSHPSTTSAPSSPVLTEGRHRQHTFSIFSKWQGNSGSSHSKSKVHDGNSDIKAVTQKIDWLEPLVIVLRKQLVLTSSLKLPSESVTNSSSGNSELHKDPHSSDWIVREIKHLVLQILATLLNPGTSLRRNMSSCSSCSQTSSASSVGNPFAMMGAEFANRLVSVLFDTALASSDVCGKSGHERERRRRGKMPLVESHAGFANVLDPLAGNGFALPCQDVEIAVQSIRLLCQCVLSYQSHFMDAFLQLPNLGNSLMRLLLHSPSRRIRAETCHELEQLIYLVTCQHPTSSWLAFMDHSSALMSSGYGVETCCHLYNRDTISPPPPLSYRFGIISREKAISTPLLDVLFRFLFTPTGDWSLPPGVWTRQSESEGLSMGSLSEEEKRCGMQCLEYFRLCGRLMALAESTCLMHYGGLDHVGILQHELQWLRKLAEGSCVGVTWGETVFSPLETAVLSGHLRFLRVTCSQLVASIVAWTKRQTATDGCSATSFGSNSQRLETANQRSTSGCQGLFPPSSLLRMLQIKSTEINSIPSSNNFKPEPLSIMVGSGSFHNNHHETMDGLLVVTSRCLKSLRDLVARLLVHFLFPSAFKLLDDLSAGPRRQLINRFLPAISSSETLITIGGHKKKVGLLDGNLMSKPTLLLLLKPPPQRLDGKARIEAFLLLQFLGRMDVDSLEQIVEIVTCLHRNRHFDDCSVDQQGPEPKKVDSNFCTKVGEEENTHEDNAFGSVVNPIVWDYNPVLLGRAVCNFAGLKNGGATCYMNAVLQQLFMQPGIAERLLDVSTEKLDESSLLYQMQELFLNLLFSQLQFYEPVSFWKSFRLWDQPIETREQQDAFDFFQALIDQLDENLKKVEEEPYFTKLFHGTLSDTILCEDCGHRYDREQSFSAINLTVCTGDLIEAMKQYIRDEILDGDNAYFCERCQVKQKAIKKLAFNSLPPLLCMQLKRFGFDWERQMAVKCNDRFSFPRRLDMSPFISDASLTPIRSGDIYDQPHYKNVISNTPVKRGFHLFDPEEDSEDQTTSTLPPKPNSSQTLGGESVGDGIPATVFSQLHAPNLRTPSDSIDQAQSFVYDLVGIVIHSGQAHAGHYYSYIRDRGRLESSGIDRISSMSGNSRNNLMFTRVGTLTHGSVENFPPSEESKPPRWLKFNDTLVEEVEMQDDEMLERECFGGTYLFECPGRAPEKRTRHFNAYLLFYQRIPVGGVCNGGVYRSSDIMSHHNYQRTHRISESSSKMRPSVEAIFANQTGRKTPSASAIDQKRASIAELTDIVSRGNRCNAFTVNPHTLLSPPVNPDRRRNHSMSHSQNLSYCLNAAMVSSNNSHVDDIHRRMSVDSVANRLAHNPATMVIKGEETNKGALMLQRIQKRNLAFLCDQGMHSPDYTTFIFNVATGVLADLSSLRAEPTRALLATRLVANFLFNTAYLALASAVKVEVTPPLDGDGMGLNLIDPRAPENATYVMNTARELDQEWMQLLTNLASANQAAVNWTLHFMTTSPSQPLLNYLLVCPKPLIRHHTANLIGTLLRTFYTFQDASILNKNLNSLVDSLLCLVDRQDVLQYAHQSASFFGLLRGYSDTCPHAVVHLSNSRAFCRLLSFLVEYGDNRTMVSHHTPLKSGLSFFPTWSARVRSWPMSQIKELGNCYQLLGQLILQANLDHFRTRGCPAPLTPGKLLLNPQPETVRWLGLDDPLSPSLSPVLPPNQRYVGIFLFLEILLHSFIDNPAVLAPPQSTSTAVDSSLAAGLSNRRRYGSGGLRQDESLSVRETMMTLVTHLLWSWWTPSAALISHLLSAVPSRPIPELRLHFDLLRQVLLIRDELQSARILAVLHGLKGHAWSLRPDFDDENDASLAKTLPPDEEAEYEGTSEDVSQEGIPNFARKGLLIFIVTECHLDPRRAYQCMKFLVEIASEIEAVVEELSRFPQLWKPAVDWLRGLIDSSESSTAQSTAAMYGPKTSLQHNKQLLPGVTGDSLDAAIFLRSSSGTFGGIVLPTLPGSTMRRTNEGQSDELLAFKRTSSAQTTLTEAAELLATMPRLSSTLLQPHREDTDTNLP